MMIELVVLFSFNPSSRKLIPFLKLRLRMIYNNISPSITCCKNMQTSKPKPRLEQKCPAQKAAVMKRRKTFQAALLWKKDCTRFAFRGKEKKFLNWVCIFLLCMICSRERKDISRSKVFLHSGKIFLWMCISCIVNFSFAFMERSSLLRKKITAEILMYCSYFLRKKKYFELLESRTSYRICKL